MNNRPLAILVVGIMISVGLISCFSQKVNAADSGEAQGWTASYTYSPHPGYYKETITFTGTAGCDDPVTWDWTFPGGVHKYGNPVTYSFAPNWQTTNYPVNLKVTNSTGASGGCYGFAQVKIAYDLCGDAGASPVLAPVGNPVTISIEANNEGNHICPAGYKMTVEIVKGIFNIHVAWPGNLTGPYDLNPTETQSGMTSTWGYPHPAGIYRAKVTFDTRFDTDTSDNIVYSNWFTLY